MQLDVRVKDTESREYWAEFVRLKDGFIFDELHVRSVTQLPMGAVSFSFDYTRHGRLQRNLAPFEITKQEWAPVAVAVATAVTNLAGGGTATDRNRVGREALASTQLVTRFFNDASRQWNHLDRAATEDFAASLIAIDALAPVQE